MTGDFGRVRDAATHSWLFRRAGAVTELLIAAWRSSRVGSTVDASLASLADVGTAQRIRWIATAIAIAAVAHLAIRSTLASTVVPALPALLIAGVAVFGAVVAWQADAFARAWRER